jgi:site-specific DNA-methyltransferase (adenine-specific)
VADLRNKLYYGDNLEVLQRYVRSGSVDLIYLDPPFNSRQDYNVLFAEKDGSRSSSQIRAFEDTWEWNIDAERAYERIVEAGGRVADAMRAFRTFLFASDMMAYLSMMAPRLVELRRVLKETGSIYLHCDPTASHYLKILMDAIFGGPCFKNEIIWKRTTTKNDYAQGATNWPRVHDVLLTFSKCPDSARFDQPFAPLSESYVNSHYNLKDQQGRHYQLTDLTAPGSGMRGHPQYEFMGVTRYWRYNKEKMLKLSAEGRVIQPRPGAVPRYKRFLDEMKGVAITDIWTDIPPINSQAQERLGYPTQKPEALLERLIKTSSNEGDLILDPFCGCGTTIQVSQRLNRRWIGVDVTHLAIGLIKKRLSDAFGDGIRRTYEVVGEPTDYAGAAELAAEDKYQFQWWALGQVGARPIEQKKGADRGIDGRLYFHDEGPGKSKQIIFSVKAGGVTVSQVRDLRGVLEREKAEIGVFICFEEPTKPMLREATEAGLYRSGPLSRETYPRIQILTIQQILDGKQPQYPRHRIDDTFKKAPKVAPEAATNYTLPWDSVATHS